MSARVVFMGSPDFALPSLRALASLGGRVARGRVAKRIETTETRQYTVVGVVTQPDRPSGRGRELKPPPVKTLAFELGLPLLQPEKLRQPEAMEQLRGWAPDLIVVAAFGQILKPEVLDLPHYGCINVHASLLPRWRGAAPINAAILLGDKETGITIMKMDQGLDTGPILNRRAIPIRWDDTAGSVSGTLSNLGADLLLETLPGYLSGKIVPQPQPEEGVTYAPMLKKEEGRLDFVHPAGELARRVRAFNPWPGAFLDFNGVQLKVHRAHEEPCPDNQQKPGTCIIHLGLPAVFSSEGLLVLDEVQPPGKKSMSGQAFLAGARHWET